MANTTHDTHLCYRYLLNYLENMKKQSRSCPFTSLSLEQIDRCLENFVHAERKYLSTRNNVRLAKFQDIIHEKALCQTVATYSLTINLVSGSNIIGKREEIPIDRMGFGF